MYFFSKVHKMVENKLTWTYHKLSFRTSPKKCGNLAYGEGGSEFFACNLYIFQYDREGRVRKGHPQVWGRKLKGHSLDTDDVSPEGTSPGMGTET